MFEFAWPWAGILLLAPILVNRFWPKRQREPENSLEGERTTLLHPHLELLRSAFQARKPRRSLASYLYRLLLYLLWAALVGALMGPQLLEPRTEVMTPGYDLLLAVDASHSMDALYSWSAQESDVPPSQVRSVPWHTPSWREQRSG